MRTAAGSIACDANVERGFQDPLQLQRQVQLPPPAFVELGRAIALPDKAVTHFLTRGAILDQNEIPGLHETDRSRVVGGGQDALESFTRNWSRFELPAYVTSKRDSLIDRCAFFI